MGGLDHFVSVSVVEDKIYLRTYRIPFKRSSGRSPYIKLMPCGPFLDLTVRRVESASGEVQREAMRKPKQKKLKRTKNVDYNKFGHKVGQIHVQRANIDRLATRNFKGIGPKLLRRKS